MVTRKNWTTAQQLLEMLDDGYRYELVRGEIRKMPPSFEEHGLVSANVAVDLAPYVRRNGLGRVIVAKTGYLLESNPDHVRAPDVSFLRQERLSPPGEGRSFVQGAPDLAFEVLSPSNRPGPMAEKVADYLAAGCPMVVVIDPDARNVTVHRPGEEPLVLKDSDTLDGGDVVPGWRMPVREIFS